MRREREVFGLKDSTSLRAPTVVEPFNLTQRSAARAERAPAPVCARVAAASAAEVAAAVMRVEL